ncbi:hypothetical protein V6N11_082867 [Hibiscus sabdariffa]|uniref:CCHC-type domain-containing protein n=1 Tax=Hibiscus sabdariffa TaxID=183260 RepID=A0ABR2QK52_9ROSI
MFIIVEGVVPTLKYYKNFNIHREKVVDFTWLSSQAFNFRIFYSNARCIVNDDETKTIEVESYIMGRTILLDVATIANHLGLEDEGVEDELAHIPFVHVPGSSVFDLDAHDPKSVFTRPRVPIPYDQYWYPSALNNHQCPYRITSTDTQGLRIPVAIWRTDTQGEYRYPRHKYRYPLHQKGCNGWKMFLTAPNNSQRSPTARYSIGTIKQASKHQEKANTSKHQEKANASIGDSQPTNKPPYFNGASYAYWKNHMKLFMQAFDLEAWKVIVSGYTPPSTDIETWNQEENKKLSTNSKAMHLIFCALGPDEYGRVSSCSNAKEIWDKLEVTHEGTNEVKETKIGLLDLDYENFKMKPNEDIKTMSDHFSVIANGLKGYGEAILEDKLVRKMIYFLPNSWDPKKTAIIEAKNLKTLKLDELIEDDEEKEMAMFAKRFKRLMKSNNGRKFQRREDFMNKTHKEEEKDQIICYECKKPGYMKVECPNLKKSLEGKKHKNFVATWSDDDVGT